MLLRRSQPTIRKLSDPIRPVHGVPFSDMVSGSVSPLERNPLSAKGWKNRESDGVGLGVVAALEKSATNPKKMEKIKHVSLSAPISIASNNHEPGCNWRCRDERRVEVDVNQLARDNLQGFRMAEFLNYCYLCRKRLHGKDIYMYRGEKAFCSVECRYQQIVSDEFHEKCGSESEALRPSSASRSSCTDDCRLLFTGMAAA